MRRSRRSAGPWAIWRPSGVVDALWRAMGRAGVVLGVALLFGAPGRPGAGSPAAAGCPAAHARGRAPASREVAASLPGEYLYAIGAQDLAGRFSDPRRIAAASSGQVLVSDAASHRVLAFDAGGRFEASWGGAGDAEGRFCVPAGLAASDDAVIVCDLCLGRVQVFDPLGRFVAAWDRVLGGDAVRPRPYQPADVAPGPAGTVFVADALDNRILQLDRDGQKVAEWGGAGDGAGQFVSLAALDATPDGRLFALDDALGRIQVFGDDGTLLDTWPIGAARDVAASADRIYVVGVSEAPLRWYDASGALLGHVARGAELAPGVSGLVAPVSVAAGLDGSVYVLETSGPDREARVVRLTGEARYAGGWTGGPVAPGLIDPAALAMTLDGSLIVADAAHSRVQELAADGRVLAVWPVTTDAGQRATPGGVASGGDGTMFVALSGAGRVVHLGAAGQLLGEFGASGEQLGEFGPGAPGALAITHPVAATPLRLYAADPPNTRVQAFALDGEVRFAFGSAGTGEGQFPDGAVGDVALTSAGEVVVTDSLSGRQTVRVFDADGGYRRSFDGQVGADSRLAPLRGIAAGPDGLLYTSDPRGRIQVHTADGAFVGQWDTTTSRPDLVPSPGDLEVAADGRLYLADRTHHLVHVFGPSRAAGWRVAYFADEWLGGAPGEVYDTDALDLAWGSASPVPGDTDNAFSLRASRFVTLPEGETRFALDADGGVRLWLDDRLLVDEWREQQGVHYAAARVGSGEHFVQLEYANAAGDARLAVRMGDEVPTLTPSPTPRFTLTPTATRASATSTLAATPTGAPSTEVLPTASAAPDGRVLFLPLAQRRP